MLQSLSYQPLPAVLLNALARGFIISGVLQLIAILAGLQQSSLMQLVMLGLILGFIIASIDTLEKYSARSYLRKHPKR